MYGGPTICGRFHSISLEQPFCGCALNYVSTLLKVCSCDSYDFVHKQANLHTCNLLRYSVSSLKSSQLMMFQALMQSSPEVLVALGVSPQAIAAEIDRQQSIDRLKVSLNRPHLCSQE